MTTLGQSWINLLDRIVKTGTPMAEEGTECLAIKVAFASQARPDPVLERFGNRQIMAEMKKVFFAEGPNALGHSYAGLMRGPGGRNDLQDVIALLRTEPWSKRAVLTLCGPPNGKVPCINIVQFLIRDNRLQTVYFARGQDVFRKFYADGLCVASMARTVAKGVGVRVGPVTGFIGSGHIYHSDRDAIEKVLRDGKPFLPKDAPLMDGEPSTVKPRRRRSSVTAFNHARRQNANRGSGTGARTKRAQPRKAGRK